MLSALQPTKNAPARTSERNLIFIDTTIILDHKYNKFSATTHTKPLYVHQMPFPVYKHRQGGAGGLPVWRRWTVRVAQVDCQSGAGAIFSWLPAPLSNDIFLILSLLVISPGAGPLHFFAPAPFRATEMVVSSMEKAGVAWMKWGLRHSVQRRWWFRP